MGREEAKSRGALTFIYRREEGHRRLRRNCLGQEEARRFEGIESFQKESVEESDATKDSKRGSKKNPRDLTTKKPRSP